MTTFDLHIIRRLLIGFVFMTGALIVFFILIHYLEHVDDFLDREAPMWEIYTIYYPSYIPEIMRLTSPLALFLSCIYLTGKLAQQLQLVALQTSGVSLYRLLRPYLAVALLVTGFMIWFNGWIVPITNGTVLEYDSKYLRDAPRQIDTSDIHRQSPSGILSVGFFERRTNMAYRVSLQQFSRDQRLVKRVDAVHMQWVDSLKLWRLTDAVVRTFSVEGSEHRFVRDELDTLLTVYPRDLARTERDIESMTIPVAADYVEQLQRSGANNIGRPLVGYYTKFSYPFANLILVLIALPLAAVRRRGGQAVQIGLGLLAAFSYLVLQKLTEPLGYFGELPPALAAWLPHVVFLIVALVMLVRARK
ncbi:MAG: LptF/LptG family permease [Rhodothermales bacterium]